jgi:hypothetical protein
MVAVSREQCVAMAGTIELPFEGGRRPYTLVTRGCTGAARAIGKARSTTLAAPSLKLREHRISALVYRGGALRGRPSAAI